MWLLAIAFLAAGNQSLEAQGVLIGAKGGVNIANVSTDDPEIGDTESASGLILGAFVSFELGDFLVLQPEGFYSQKGFEVSEGDFEGSAGLDYIDVALLLKGMLTPPGTAVRPAVYAGGVVSFESSCDLTLDGVPFDCDDPEADFERGETDFGVAFGAELQFDLGQAILLADGRYTLGLRNLDTSEDVSQSVKSRMWSFMAGVGFRVN
jgi:hypothetical protein